jgi:hypothetical protein
VRFAEYIFIVVVWMNVNIQSEVNKIFDKNKTVATAAKCKDIYIYISAKLIMKSRPYERQHGW